MKGVVYMPFRRVNVRRSIDGILAADPELKQMWDESRTEYRLLGEIVRIRKEKGLSQSDLADASGNRQQVISRIEKRESSPTLKTLCKLLDALGYEIVLKPKNSRTAKA